MPRLRNPSPQRTAIAHCRLTEPELCEWREKAARAGVSLSELMRASMSRTRTWTAPALSAVRERTRELARMGSNLNQIARWANTHKGAADAAEVIAHLVAIEQALASLRRLESPPPEE